MLPSKVAAVAVLAAACASVASAWKISSLVQQWDSRGANAWTDQTGQPVDFKGTPGCEIIHLEGAQGHDFRPDGDWYLTLVTDPENDNKKEFDGCINCPEGCCTDRHDVNHIDHPNTFGYVTFRNLAYNFAYSDNYCVPKGFILAGPNPDQPNKLPGDPKLNDCDPKYGGWCQDRSGPNGTNAEQKQGDCYFAHAVLATNYKPLACKVTAVPIGIYGGGLWMEGAVAHQLTVVGSDSDVKANGTLLEGYLHNTPVDCTHWEATHADRLQTVVKQQCDKQFHGMFNRQADVAADGTGYCSSKCNAHKDFQQCSAVACHDDGSAGCGIYDLAFSTDFDFSMVASDGDTPLECSTAGDTAGKEEKAFIHVKITAKTADPQSQITAAVTTKDAALPLTNPIDVCCAADEAGGGGGGGTGNGDGTDNNSGNTGGNTGGTGNSNGDSGSQTSIGSRVFACVVAYAVLALLASFA